MYASNYDSATPAMIEEVAGIARALKATIHFVHIQDAASNSSSEKVDISWNELFPSADPGHGFEIHTIVGNDVIGELSAYAEKHEIHMMAFVSKHRSFWQNLWHTSVTENIALSTNTPLMVIHLDDLETVSKDV
jgi:nucleotide-binding universal stress UspA family protein